MFEDDPLEAVDERELAELSEAVRDEEAGELEPSKLTTLSAIVDLLAKKIEERTLVGLVIFDASNLGPWERQHGASAFDAVMTRLAANVERMRGDCIRVEDEICYEAAGGEGLLVFLSRPRNTDTESGAVDFDEVIARIKRGVFEPSHDAQLSIHRALEKIAAGSALIIRNSSVDPRREVYRAIRRARADAQANYLEMQRQRHRVVGQMIAHRKIHTLYQPIVELGSNEVMGFEALSRAEESESERLGVHLFVAAARAELDGELDQTCRTLSVRRRPGLSDTRKLFINCLPPTFYHPMEDLELLIDAWVADGLSPEQLVFEVTENITHDQAQRILPSVRRLRARGFKFALDDMGTGTTNLRLLTDLEPDYIKMDIALTRGIAQSPQKQALARYLLELGQKCNAELIAEGIENAEDCQTLCEIGFGFGQGFYLGRPQSREQAAQLIAQEA
jgi:EAL domain-containing protein (putative c-di-GMP-specific phosphodiesterase class I)